MTQGISFDADTLRVAAPMRRAFERLAAGLVKHGVLAKKEGRWEPAPGFVDAADSAGHVLRSYIEKHPGHLPEALLCEANCAELGSILRGEKDAVQVLFSGIGAELLEQFYGDGLFTSQWLGAIAAALDATARRLPEGRGLRILEIGAGTGGLASQDIAPPRAWFAFLHLQRCVRCFLFCGAAKARRVSGSGIQDFRSRKTGRGAGAGSGVVRLHHRDQRCARGQRCARRVAKSARSARAGRKPHFHGYRHAATLDEDGLRPNERLVAFHRSRSAPRTAAARKGAMGNGAARDRFQRDDVIAGPDRSYWRRRPDRSAGSQSRTGNCGTGQDRGRGAGGKVVARIRRRI